MSHLISAIVTVYNRATMVAAAVTSLTRQTADNLEIIVVDDGSSDDSARVVEGIADRRVRLIRHDRNLGIPAARNSGLEAARGDYIAWLDSDDLSRLGRLERQAAYLDANPHVAMVGACAGRIAKDGRPRRGARVPMLTHEDIRAQLLFRSAFQQSSIMGRADILKAYPYRSSFPVCEDVDMFVRLTADHRVANLPEVLVDRRLHQGQTIQRQSQRIRERKRDIFRHSLTELGIAASEAELERHVTLGNLKAQPLGRDFLEWSEEWLERIGASNRTTQLYDTQALAFVCGRIWLLAARAALGGPDRGFALTRLARSRLTAGIVNRNGRAWLRRASRLKLGLG